MKITPIILLSWILCQSVSANPTGPQVMQGQVQFNQPDVNTLNITNSAGAILHWQQFSIQQNETTRFIQPSIDSAVLNRVVGQDPSDILGHLLSNGRVFLINPNGIVFGPGSVIDTAGLVASTLNMTDGDFMTGTYRFEGTDAGVIENRGYIKAGADGDIFLIAPNIENSGIIETQGGKLILAAGQSVTLASLDSDDIVFDIQAPDNEVVNLGSMLTHGGAAAIFAGTIQHSGAINADSIRVDTQGRIQLFAQQDIRTELGSTLSASGPSGGTVDLEAPSVIISGTVEAKGESGDGGAIGIIGTDWISVGGTIDASGAIGGMIDIEAGGLSIAAPVLTQGTKGQGGYIQIHTATESVENTAALIDVSGTTGGTISNVADQQITTSGTYLARGSGGSGGVIDLSAPATKLLSPSFDASGYRGGGRVRLGGEYQGGKDLETDELPNAHTLVATDATRINADTTGTDGGGGKVIIWSDEESIFLGNISASPGIESGAGGFVEISSGGDLSYDGNVETGDGDRAGTVLFDPKNLTIAAGTAAINQLDLILGFNYGDVAELGALDDGDLFSRVALDGTRLVVGAPTDDGAGNVAADAGAVYLFTFSDTLFNGAVLEGTIGVGYSGGKNVDMTGIVDSGDRFGVSTSIDGDRLAVGAPFDDGSGNGSTDAGAVLLFTFTDTAFSGGVHEGTLGVGYSGGKDINLTGVVDAGDEFGQASLDGTRLAVGARFDDAAGNTGNSNGAVHLFTFTDLAFNGGVLEGSIGEGYTGGKNLDVGSVLDDIDVFGRAVSLDGTTLAVGATGDDGFGVASADEIGAVHLFTFSDLAFNGATLEATIGEGYTGGKNVDLSSALDVDDQFGNAISLDSGRLAVVGPNDDGAGNAVTDSGAAYLFSFTDGIFNGGQHESTIGAGYTGPKDIDISGMLESGDNLGNVALDGTRLAIGVVRDDGAGNGATDVGAVHLFTFTDSVFNGGLLEGTIGAGYSGGNNVDVPSLETGDIFGRSVALNGAGDRLAVGAPSDDGSGNLDSGAGAVHLFSFTDTSFSGGSLTGTIGAGYSGGNNVDVPSLAMDDAFGRSVALNGAGDRLAVGAEGDDGAGNSVNGAGAVYLFSFTDTSFSGGTLTGTIGADYSGGNDVDVTSLESFDLFGVSVALNAAGDRLAVGACCDDGFGNSGFDTGAVYLFSFTDTSFSGGTLIGTMGAGYSGGNNVGVTGLVASDGFGGSVALNSAGDRLAAGACCAGNNAVRLFTFTDTSFSGGSLTGTIGAGFNGVNDVDVTLGAGGDGFGIGVALNDLGDRLVVGAYQDDGAGNLVTDAGAVYLFSFTDTNFSGGALIGMMGAGYSGGNNVNVTGLEVGDQFGFSVALNAVGDRLAVGAQSDDGAGNGAADTGAVHLFTFTDTSFNGGQFTGTIGANYGTKDLNLSVSGLDNGDEFGETVSLNGTRLAVGAPLDAGADNLTTDVGAVYLFTFTDTDLNGPALEAILGAGYTGGKNLDLSGVLDGGPPGDLFGFSVSLDGTRLAVGTEQESGFGNGSNSSGAVRLFSFTDNAFSGGVLEATLGVGYNTGKDIDLSGVLDPGDYFGSSVSLDGTQLAVGAQFDTGANNSNTDAGAVYLFTFSDNAFNGGTLQGAIGIGYTPGTKGPNDIDLSSMIDPFDRFGLSVSLEGTNLAVSAPRDNGSGNTTTETGAVYLFTFTDTSFSGGTLEATLGSGYSGGKNLNLSGVLDDSDLFGRGLSLDGTRLAVGADFDDGAGNTTSNTGAAYLFTFTDTTFTGGSLEATIGAGYTGGKNVDLGAVLDDGDTFARSLSLVGNKLAVGAHGDAGLGNVGVALGAVYFFDLSGGLDGATFANNPTGDSIITNGTITALLDTSQAVILQANNDLTVNAPIITNEGGAGGDLTLQAGRSVLINADIFTDNGALTIVANDPGAVSADRDVGAAEITMLSGTTLDAGTNNISLDISTFSTGGNIRIANLIGNTVTIDTFASGSITGLDLITAPIINFQTGDGTGDVGTLAEPIRTEFLASGTVIRVGDDATTASGSTNILANGDLTIGEVYVNGFFIANSLGSNLTVEADAGYPLFDTGFSNIFLIAGNTLTINRSISGSGFYFTAPSFVHNTGTLTSQVGPIDITADSVSINDVMTAGGVADITIQPMTLSQTIEIGGTGGLNLSLAELQLINTNGSLVIGRSDGTGSLSLMTPLSSGDINATSLNLASGSILIDNNIDFSTEGENLGLESSGSIQIINNFGVPTASLNVDLGTGTLFLNGLGSGTFQIQGGTAGTNYAHVNAGTVQTLSDLDSIDIIGGTGGILSSASLNSTGSMNLTVTNGITITADSATDDDYAHLESSGGQNITAGFIEITSGPESLGFGTGIINSGGTQVITTTGQNASNEGIVVTGEGLAELWCNSSCTGQNITVNDADFVRLDAGAGSVFTALASVSTQDIVLQGTGLNSLIVGSGTSQGPVEITSTGNQSITAGQTGENGSIIVLAGTTSAASRIGSNLAQTISAQDDIFVIGGTAASGNAPAQIQASNGMQIINAGNLIQVQGGTVGTNNSALIESLSGSNVTASDIQVLAGGTGISNKSELVARGALQTIDATNSIVIQGGTGGSDNYAGIFSAVDQDITSGSGGITLTAGTGSAIGNNDALIMLIVNGPYSQDITSPTGTIYLTGGSDYGIAQIRGNALTITTKELILEMPSSGSGTNSASQIISNDQHIMVTDDLILQNKNPFASAGGPLIQSFGAIQEIEAGYIEISNESPSTTVDISQRGPGPQIINTTSKNVSGEGIRIEDNGKGARIVCEGPVAGGACSQQTVTVTDADYVRLLATNPTSPFGSEISAGDGSIPQTVQIAGSGMNILEIGGPTNESFAGIFADGPSQTVIVGNAGENGSLIITGGVNDVTATSISAGANSGNTSQTVVVQGDITVTGGNAPAGSIYGFGLLAWGNQSVTSVAGNITITAGVGVSGDNDAFITQLGPGFTQSVSAPDGTIHLIGGSDFGLAEINNYLYPQTITAGTLIMEIPVTGTATSSAARINGGDQFITVTNGLIIDNAHPNAVGAATGILGIGGTMQDITAGFIEIINESSGAGITQFGAGSQVIHTTSKNASGEGIHLENNGAGTAFIVCANDGMSVFCNNQQVTVTDADFVRIISNSADSLFGAGIVTGNPGGFPGLVSQSVLIHGTGLNTLEIGSPAGASPAQIINTSGPSQTVTVGNPGENGSIIITGGSADGAFSGIGSGAFGTTTQIVTVQDSINIIGGNAATNSSATISAFGNQTITAGAGGINITGGANSVSGTGNIAEITQLGNGFNQNITLNNGGDLVLTGGNGVDNNNARIENFGGDINIQQGSGTGITDVILTGGGGVNSVNNSVRIESKNPVGGDVLIDINGDLILTSTAEATTTDNRTRIHASGGNFTLLVGGDVLITGGAGTDAEAAISAEFTLDLDAGGSLTIVGGSGTDSSAGMGAQTVLVDTGGPITITGGSNTGAKVGIGWDEGSIMIVLGNTEPIGGDINITGGGATGFTGLGTDCVASPCNANITINTAGSLNLQSGAGSPVLIGNLTQDAGMITVTAGTGGTGGIALNDGRIITDDDVLLSVSNATGSISQSADGVIDIGTNTLVVQTGGGDVSLLGTGNIIGNLVTDIGPCGSLVLTNSLVTNLGDTNVCGDVTLTSAAAIAISGPLTAGVLNLDASGAITVDTSSAVSLGSISGTSVSLTGASIMDGNGTATNIVGGSVTIDAAGGFGSLSDPIETQISGPIQINVSSGDISIIQTGTLTLTSNTITSGDINLSASSELVINDATLSGNQVQLSGSTVQVSASSSSADVYAAGDLDIVTTGDVIVQGSDTSSGAYAKISAAGIITIDAVNVDIIGGDADGASAGIDPTVLDMTLSGDLNLTGGAGAMSSAILAADVMNLTVAGNINLTGGAGQDAYALINGVAGDVTVLSGPVSLVAGTGANADAAFIANEGSGILSIATGNCANCEGLTADPLQDPAAQAGLFGSVLFTLAETPNNQQVIVLNDYTFESLQLINIPGTGTEGEGEGEGEETILECR